MAMTQIDDNEDDAVPSNPQRAAERVLHDAALDAIKAALEAPGTPVHDHSCTVSGRGLLEATWKAP